MILGSLQVKEKLDPALLEIVVKRFIASLHHEKLALDEISRLYLDPRVYQIYAKSSREAAFQTYELFKARLFDILEKAGTIRADGVQREHLDIRHVIAFNQSLALDGLPRESPVWFKFYEVVLQNQRAIDFMDLVQLVRSIHEAPRTGATVD